jgi:vacuolar-type H+-ATPase subunit I/STV1
MARLKVFVTSDGLTDYVVAVSSKAKALEAWGIRQDVFKEGLARRTDDKELVKAAEARPGEVLRRPSGTRGELERLTPKARPKPSGPSKAVLKRIAELEAKLLELDRAHDAAQAKIEAERTDLDAREERLNAAHEAKRAKIEGALNAARA